MTATYLLAETIALDGASEWVFVAFVGVVGLLVGSFLNVVIYRVPAEESVVSPRSRCPSCGHQITAAENIPVVSWLVLRGRCSSCGSRISARYPLVELLTGALFAVMAWQFGLSWELPAFLYLVAIGVALSFIDLDTHRLPDKLTLPSYPVALVLLLLPTLLDVRWPDLWRALAGGAILLAFYFIVWFIYPSGMGFGDVKLSGVLGIYLGWLGWGILAVGAFLGFLIGAVVGVTLMLASGAGRKTKVPFGPSMVAGALVAVVAGSAISSWYAGLMGF